MSNTTQDGDNYISPLFKMVKLLRIYVAVHVVFCYLMFFVCYDFASEIKRKVQETKREKKQ